MASIKKNIELFIGNFFVDNKETAQAVFAKAVPVLDRYANKGLIHKNKAARHKSRLSAHIKAL